MGRVREGKRTRSETEDKWGSRLTPGWGETLSRGGGSGTEVVCRQSLSLEIKEPGLHAAGQFHKCGVVN